MTTVWGDGSGGSSAVTDSYLLGVGGNARSYTAYAKLPAGQALAGAGTYTDTLIVTIAF